MRGGSFLHQKIVWFGLSKTVPVREESVNGFRIMVYDHCITCFTCRSDNVSYAQLVTISIKETLILEKLCSFMASNGGWNTLQPCAVCVLSFCICFHSYLRIPLCHCLVCRSSVSLLLEYTIYGNTVPCT